MFGRIKSLKNNFGYTMIELVVYIAILAIVFIVVVSSLITVYQTFLKARVERSLSENGALAMEVMIRDIRSATTTEIAGSTFGSHPGELDLLNISYSLSGDALFRDEDGGLAFEITSDEVRVTNLMFYRTATTTVEGDRELIKIELGLESGEGQFLKAKNFYGSAVLRGTY